MSDFLLREPVGSDLAFLYATWLRELRAADRSPLPDDLYFPAHRAFIDRVLADKRVAVAIACTEDDPTEILGYAIGVPHEVLIWVHVLPLLRGKGLPLVPALLSKVGCPPGTPSAFQMPSGRALQNPPRARWARRIFSPTTPSASRGPSRS